MQLEALREYSDILRDVDWDMTPEDAVTRYLEWGTSWSRGNNMVRSKSDVSYYFTISTWHDPPLIRLMKINMDEGLELAAIEAPRELAERFLETAPATKGVFPLSGEIREWLEEQVEKVN